MTMTTELDGADDFAGVQFVGFAEVKASIDNLTAETARLRKRQDRLAQGIHPITMPPVPITLSSGTGTLNQPNLLGPQSGKFWDIHRVSVANYTAGYVIMYLNAQNADVLYKFDADSTSGVQVQTFGKAQILLGSNDNLFFYASGITTANNLAIAFAGTEIDAPLIGDYLL
jgi:hypothetical protein